MLDILMTYLESGREQKPIFKIFIISQMIYVHPNIQPDLRFFQNPAEFLDVNISLEGFFSTDLYSKLTDKHARVSKLKKIQPS